MPLHESCSCSRIDCALADHNSQHNTPIFACSAKNPENKGRPGVPSAGPEPEYSEQQQEKFQGRAWIGVDDRSLLDVAGTELLLVGAKDDPVGTGEWTAPSWFAD